MIQTQVQIPDDLYHKAKLVAKEREWSFAEVTRRGLEYMIRVCPPNTSLPSELKLPVLEAGQFVDGFDDLDLRAVGEEDGLLK